METLQGPYKDSLLKGDYVCFHASLREFTWAPKAKACRIIAFWVPKVTAVLLATFKGPRDSNCDPRIQYGGQINYQYHVEVHVRYHILYLYKEYGTIILVHSRKLTWKPKKGPIKTPVLLKEDYMSFHVSFRECISLGPHIRMKVLASQAHCILQQPSMRIYTPTSLLPHA